MAQIDTLIYYDGKSITISTVETFKASIQSKNLALAHQGQLSRTHQYYLLGDHGGPLLVGERERKQLDKCVSTTKASTKIKSRDQTHH